MRRQYFDYLFLQVNAFLLNDEYLIFRNPLELYSRITKDSVYFKSIDELLAYEIEGRTIWDYISEMDDLYLPFQGRGSRGGSGNKKKFKFNHADRNKNNSKALLPAYANTRIKSKTPEGALAEFKSKHLKSDREFAYEVDSNGYVHQYVQGGRHSVGISSSGAKLARGQKTTIIHNHPNGGAFSDTDLLTFASTSRSQSVVASGKNYDYIITKHSSFKPNSFIKAVQNAEMQGSDYDSAVDSWLRKNQRRYGYTYTRNSNK